MVFRPDGHLRQASDPGQHGETHAGCVKVDCLSLEDRPRTDDRHLAAQYVDQLWKLVEVGPAQHAADPGHARVVRLRPCRTWCAVAHGPELKHLEWLFAVAEPLLGEGHWTRRIKSDCDC